MSDFPLEMFEKFREDVGAALQELKTGQALMNVNLGNLQGDVTTMDRKLDNRLVKIEDTLFGNEPDHVVGLVEKTRRLQFEWKKLVGVGVILSALVVEILKAGVASLWVHLIH